MAGAGVYDETNKQTYTYTFVGTQNALAAELVALRQAVTLAGKTKEKTRIYTDSLTSLFLIRKWIHAPNKLKYHRYKNTIKSIIDIANESGNEMTFAKVKAHTGVPGNEVADKCAKFAATPAEERKTTYIDGVIDELECEHLEDTEEKYPGGWIMKHQGKTIRTRKQLDDICEERHIHDIMTGDAAKTAKIRKMTYEICKQSTHTDQTKWIETRGATAIWESGITDGNKTIYYKHMWDKVWTPNSPGHPEYIKGVQQPCKVCNSGIINGAHIRGGCKHDAIKAGYTHRHNEIVAQIVTYLRRGEEGNRYVRTDAGKKSDIRSTSNETIDPKLLEQTGRENEEERIDEINENVREEGHPATRGKGNRKPDIVIINNLERNEEVKEGTSYDITIIEIKVIADESKAEEKKRNTDEYYKELVTKPEQKGHKVKYITLVIGSRIAVSERILTELKGILKTTTEQTKRLEKKMQQTIVTHLNKVHATYRELENSAKKPAEP